jgi:hypothetical protein
MQNVTIISFVIAALILILILFLLLKKPKNQTEKKVEKYESESGSEYVINPCPICTAAYGYKNNRMQLKDCCFRTCAGFMDGGDNIDPMTMLQSECGKKCWQCAWNSDKANNLNPCEWKLASPPLWLQPHYFFDCFKENNEDKDKAYSCCVNKCNMLNNGSEQCKEICYLESNSLYKIN